MKSRLLILTLFLVLSGSLLAQSAAKMERMERREARKQRQALELAQSRAEMIMTFSLRPISRNFESSSRPEPPGSEISNKMQS